jgi:hypothetical protein
MIEKPVTLSFTSVYALNDGALAALAIEGMAGETLVEIGPFARPDAFLERGAYFFQTMRDYCVSNTYTCLGARDAINRSVGESH